MSSDDPDPGTEPGPVPSGDQGLAGGGGRRGRAGKARGPQVETPGKPEEAKDVPALTTDDEAEEKAPTRRTDHDELEAGLLQGLPLLVPGFIVLLIGAGAAAGTWGSWRPPLADKIVLVLVGLVAIGGAVLAAFAPERLPEDLGPEVVCPQCGTRILPHGGEKEGARTGPPIPASVGEPTKGHEETTEGTAPTHAQPAEWDEDANPEPEPDEAHPDEDDFSEGTAPAPNSDKS